MNPTSYDFQELSEITEEHLNFRAIDSGLGFATNPAFKTGAMKSGAGALAAGKPVVKNTAAAASPITLPAAEFNVRLAAFFTDVFIALAPWTLVFLWTSRSTGLNVLAQQDTLLFAAFFLFTYFLLTESLGGQSVGKMLFSLRIVEDDKYEKPIGFRQALVRILGLIVGTLFFAFGLILALTDHKRRPWHDKVSGSIVRRKLF